MIPLAKFDEPFPRLRWAAFHAVLAVMIVGALIIGVLGAYVAIVEVRKAMHDGIDFDVGSQCDYIGFDGECVLNDERPW